MEYPSSNYKSIRAELKAAYKQITEQHTKLKRSTMSHKWELPNWNTYRQLRVLHIAYSMFKGATFDQVESKWHNPYSSYNLSIKAEALKLHSFYINRIIIAEDAIDQSL